MCAHCKCLTRRIHTACSSKGHPSFCLTKGGSFHAEIESQTSSGGLRKTLYFETGLVILPNQSLPAQRCGGKGNAIRARREISIDGHGRDRPSNTCFGERLRAESTTTRRGPRLVVSATLRGESFSEARPRRAADRTAAPLRG